MKTIQYYSRSGVLFLSSILTLFLYNPLAAQYTLQDDDVVVENGIIQSCSYNFEIKDIIIPDILDGQAVRGIAIKEINSGVFEDKGIQNLKLPSTIQIIGNNAFRSNQLQNLQLPLSIQVIGENSFRNNLLQSLKLPSAIHTIGDNAFRWNRLKNLDLSSCIALKTIGAEAFRGNLLSSLDLRFCIALTKIGNLAFKNNESLAAFTLPINTDFGYYFWEDELGNQYHGGEDISNFETYYYVLFFYTLTDYDVIVSEGIIESCSYDFDIKDIVIPDTLDGQVVIGIADEVYGSGVFEYKGVQSLKLPSTIQTIGVNSFRGNQLHSIDLSPCTALVSIESKAFSGNDSLTTITLPVNTEFNVYGWKDEYGIQYSGGEEISDLATYYFVAAPYTLTDDDVVVSEELIQSCTYDFRFKDIIIPDMLDGQVVRGFADRYYSGVFAGKNIQSVVLPSTIQSIGDYAFARNFITSLDFSSCKDLRSIGYSSFDNNQLTSIDLSSCTTLISIESKAFSGNDSLTTITLPVNTEFKVYGWKDEYGTQYSGGEDISDLATYYFVAATYTLTDDDVVVSEGLIQSCTYDFRFKDIIIPDMLDGQAVRGIAIKEINSGVFEDKGIQSLKLPSAIKTIGDNSFRNNQIHSLDLDSSNSLNTIGDGAFSGNTLSNLNISSCTALTSIGSSAFSGNTLSNLNLSSCTALTSIGSSAFSGNALSNLDLSSCTALTSIGSSAFSGNTLSNLNLSSCTALTSIGSSAFSGNALSNLDLSSCTALTSIGSSAFSDNTLSSLDLSSCTALISIEAHAFSANDSLAVITIPVNGELSVYGWKDGEGTLYNGGEDISDLRTYYYVPAPYTLSDGDVVVSEGLIQSCTYDFRFKDILIPDTLDGQVVIGIADKGNNSGVFASRDIQSIQLPHTIEIIGSYAFRNNQLQSLKLPSAIHTIGDEAFHSNRLQSLDLDSCKALNIIGDNAFSWNRLQSFDLSSCTALFSIGSHAFIVNDSLNTFTLPVNTEFKAYGWKDGEGNLYNGGEDISDLRTYYVVPAPYTLTDDDVVVSKGLIQSCTYDFKFKNIIIPDTLYGQAVRGIRSNDNSSGVFSRKGIVGLRLPSTIQVIGSSAFSGNSLSSLDLSSCTALTSIGFDAFWDNSLSSLDLSPCTALTSIEYSAFGYNELQSLDLDSCTALTSIGFDAFWGNSLSSLDLSSCTALMSIGSSAFSGNDSFSTITIPVNNEFRAYGWKDGEGNLYNGGEEIRYFNTNYYIPIPYTLTDIDVVVNEGIIQSCFYNFGVREIIIPDTLDGQAVIGIKGATKHEPDEYSGPFVGKGIRSVVFPSTLETIGTAFIDNRIDSIDLSICKALKTIEEGAFRDHRIRHVDFRNCNSLTTIGSGAFSGTELSSIDLSGCDALTTIGDNAFSGTELSSIDLSGCHALTTIGRKAFGGNELSSIDLSGCHALTSIGNWAFSGNKLSAIDLSGCHVLTSIGNWAFDGNKLSAIDLSSCSALQSIGDYSFNGNELSVIDLNSLESLSYIGTSAFGGNDSLGGFTLPVNIANAAFGWKDANNNSFNGGDFVTDLASNYYNLPYTLTENDVKVMDGVIYIYSLNRFIKDIIIPDTLQGQAITGISHEAFEYYDITDIVLPSTLETIGSGAFIGNRISSLDFSRCVSLTSIGNDAFSGNILSMIDLSSCSSLQIIGNSAFFGNELTNIDLSSCESLNYIGISAFQDNEFLAGFELPVNSENKEFGWKDAQRNSFDGGDFITDLSNPYYNLPYRLTDADVYIRRGILHRESSWYPLLNDIIIPDTLHGQAIKGIYAFSFKELGITNITFPSTLETIGTAAFLDNGLSSLDLSGCKSLIHIGESAFNENESLSVFDLPVNSEFPELGWKDSYRNSFQGGSTVSDLTSLYYVPASYTLTDNDVYVVDGIIKSCHFESGLNEIIIPDTLDGQMIIGITGSYIMSYPYPYYPAFYYKGIKGISLPSTLEFIGDYAFAGNGLTSVDFNGCTSLQYIGHGAFGRYEIDQEDMPHLEPAALVTNNIKFLDLSSCSSLTSIGNYAFSGNLLSSLDLPSEIRAIKGGAFKGNKLKNLDLTVCTSLNYIGEAAFSDNDSLGSFELPVNTANIDFGWKDADNNSFTGGDFVIDMENQYYNLPYTLADDDVNVINGDIQRIHFWNHLLHDIIIPDSLCGQIVTSIDVHAFRDMDITNITFPSTFRSIGSNAFSSNKLDSIDLIICTNLTYIGVGAFSGNPMSSFILPKPDIPGYVFNFWTDRDGISYSDGDTVRDLFSSYTAVFTAAYAVNFIITDGVSPVKGALVSLAGYEANETDDSGMAVFGKVIPENEIAYSVSADGYDDTGGIVSVVDLDVIENVTLSLSSFSVTFTVSDGTDPVQEAIIALDGYENAVTDGGGLAEFSEVFPENDIAYAVTHTDYETVSGLVSVVDSDVVEKITMVPLTAIPDLLANNFRLYPNPAADRVYILFNEDAEVSVLDVTGRVMLKQQHGRGESEIFLGHLKAGGYFVRVESKLGILLRKVMLQ